LLALPVAFLLAGPISKDLQNLPGTATTEVLVQFPSMPNRTQLASITAKSALWRR